MILASIGLALAFAGGAAASEVVLSRSSVQVSPGQRAAIVIELVDAKPTTYMTMEGYEGQLIAIVRLNGRAWVRTDLGPLIGMARASFLDREWDIVFADYNHDGRLDFNIGQSCGSNNFCYWMFSIENSGRVSLLRLPAGFLWVNDDAYSSRLIELTDVGVSCWAYDPAEGAGVRSRYRWNEKTSAFELVERTVGNRESVKAHAP